MVFTEISNVFLFAWVSTFQSGNFQNLSKAYLFSLDQSELVNGLSGQDNFSVIWVPSPNPWKQGGCLWCSSEGTCFEASSSETWHWCYQLSAERSWVSHASSLHPDFSICHLGLMVSCAWGPVRIIDDGQMIPACSPVDNECLINASWSD